MLFKNQWFHLKVVQKPIQKPMNSLQAHPQTIWQKTVFSLQNPTPTVERTMFSLQNHPQVIVKSMGS